jgi:hypothetical protein
LDTAVVWHAQPCWSNASRTPLANYVASGRDVAGTAAGACGSFRSRPRMFGNNKQIALMDEGLFAYHRYLT